MTAAIANIALIQLRPGTMDREANVAHMRRMVAKAVEEGKQNGKPLHMVVLPEMWNSPIDGPSFDKLAETIPAVGTPRDSFEETAFTAGKLSDTAKELGVWILAGSIPELDGDKLRNCCTVWDAEGALVKLYRKLHLFDLSLPEMSYQESARFNAGCDYGIFDTPFGKFCVAICYDLRFPELATIAARNGCMAMFYPAAFTMPTGKMHWELLQRARALDNQMYVCSCSLARDMSTSFPIYGHSMYVGPMGAVLDNAETDEAIVYAELDPAAITKARAGIPLYTQRRFDMYPDVSQGFTQKAVA